MSERLKILFVSSHWPLAAAYGAQQRVLNIGRLLSRLGDVSFVLVDFDLLNEDAVRGTKSEFNVRRIIRPFPIARRDSLDRLRHRLRHELDPSYLATRPYSASEPDRAALLSLTQQHDVIWVHTIHTANLFRIDKWPRSVLDVDDVPSRFYRSEAQTRNNSVRRSLDLRMSWIWRRRERLFTKRFDVLTVCSEDDRQYMGGQPQIHVIPNGFNPPVMRPRVPSELRRVGFIGTLKYRPNEEGMKWFIRDVWPLIKREFPPAQLRLVGLDSDGYMTKLGPDIVGLGWVQDPSDEIASWSVMIVPIKFGGGTRIKIAEGFARRCPVVSTTIGAFGYDVRNGEEALLADCAHDFASACILLLTNPQLGDALSEKAHQCFLQQWTWDSFQNIVGTVVQECLEKSNHSQIEQTSAVIGPS